jgi:hypothetical protein
VSVDVFDHIADLDSRLLRRRSGDDRDHVSESGILTDDHPGSVGQGLVRLILLDLLRQQIGAVRIESLSQTTQRSHTDLLEVRLFNIILNDMPHHIFKDAQLRVRSRVGDCPEKRIVGFGKHPAHNRIKSDEGGQCDQREFAAYGHLI